MPLPEKNTLIFLIKPEGVQEKNQGNVITILEQNNVSILSMKMGLLSKFGAQKFYIVHEKLSYYDNFTSHMSSGRIVVMKIEIEGSIKDFRNNVVGATDPEKANLDSIRERFAKNHILTVVHCSDSSESAVYEAEVINDPQCFMCF